MATAPILVITSEYRERLADLIATKREEILEIWRTRVRQTDSARELSDIIVNDEIPYLVDEIVVELRTMGVPQPGAPETQMRRQAINHGEERFKSGFSIIEVVREYSILREVICDQAEEAEIPLTGLGGQTIHRAINTAISIAIQSFSIEKANELRKRREEHVSFIVHDLKTPLNAIQIAARVIEDSLGTNPEAAAGMIQLIFRNVTRMDTMLKKIIDIERAVQSDMHNRLEPREFEPWTLVQSVLEEMQVLADDSGTSLISLVPSNITVFADAVALHSVFHNLVSNALKYTAGGKVVIGVRDSPNGDFDCWVRDTGVGISPERQSRLFTEGVHDPDQKGSTGLGLSIVKRVIDAHGGTLSVESKIGEGSTFRFTLPARHTPLPSAA